MGQLRNTMKNNKGAAMILAICVLAVVTVLCLSLLLISGTALANAQKKLSKEQARILAVTYSRELQKEIESSTKPENLEKTGIERQIGDYIWKNVNTEHWPYFNEDEAGHTKSAAWKTFQVRVDDKPEIDAWYKNVLTNLELTMYWTSEAGADAKDAKLYVVVTAERNGERSAITTVYGMSETQEKWLLEGDME